MNSYLTLGLKDGSIKLETWALTEKQNIVNKKLIKEAKLVTSRLTQRAKFPEIVVHGCWRRGVKDR